MEETGILGSLREKKTETRVEVDEQQFVTFEIAEEIYGVPVLTVQEIIGMTRITEVPNSLNFLKGVINLRGNVVPVIDLRSKFNLDCREYDSFTVIIIVEVGNVLVGMVVDTVSDVVNIPVTEIHKTPNFSSRISTDFIEGIANKEDELIILLNVNRILSNEELESIEQNSESVR